MENIKIDIHIADLLYRYDCVVVPDFGGFVANYASAKVQAIQHQFIPPSKKISFNKNLKDNDGLLSNHIAKRQSISYEEANQLINSFVGQSLIGLRRGDKIKIEKVGTLYLDPEQNIQFLAEERNDFLLDSFGLNSFRALPIQRAGAEERIEKKIKENLPLLKEEEKKRRKYYWPAAALILVFFVSVYFLNQQFSWVNTTPLQYSAIGFNNTIASKYSESKAIKVTSFVEEKSLPVEIEGYYKTSSGDITKIFLGSDDKIITSKVDNTKVEEFRPKSSLKFHVMGGCFSSLSNAKGLVNQLNKKGFDAHLLGKYKNLHAVSFGSFDNREEAVELLAKVKNRENAGSWLLVKPF